MSKELTTKTNENELFKVQDKEALAMMEADAANYSDDTAAEDISLPRLILLQSGSKQLKKSEPEYLKEAEEGDLFNTLTSNIYPSDIGVLFVPVKRRVVYLHWKDINAGGGLIENFGTDPSEFLKIEPNEKGHRRTSATTEIVKTYETFGYIIDIEKRKFQEAILSLSSTSAKKQKRFNMLIRSLTGSNGQMLPEYAGIYKITSVPEKNEVNSWYTPEFAAAGYTLGVPDIGKAMYEAAKKFAEMINSNAINVKYEQEETSESIDEEMEVM